jgi:hypothetical protein
MQGNFTQGNVPFRTFYEQYCEFGKAMDVPQGCIAESPNFKAVQLALNLIREEYEDEFKQAIMKFGTAPSLENLAEVADAVADTIYVLCHLCYTLDIPIDLVYGAVHANNMTKVGPDGKVKKREDGKVLKPEGYKPVDVWKLLDEYSAEVELKRGLRGGSNWNAQSLYPD